MIILVTKEKAMHISDETARYEVLQLKGLIRKNNHDAKSAGTCEFKLHKACLVSFIVSFHILTKSFQNHLIQMCCIWERVEKQSGKL